jgi:hypothetical protein
MTTSEAVQMMRKAMKEWEQLDADPDFEICTIFPYVIRRKGTIDNIQDVPCGDYRVYSLNGRMHYRHRLIAQQWLPNPNNLPQVHHLNGDPSDNELTNLMWVSAKTNQCNKFKYGDRDIVYVNTLPGHPFQVEVYGNWTFDNLWYSDGHFYDYTLNKFRQLPEREVGPRAMKVSQATDVDGRNHLIYYSKFRRLYNLPNDGA